MNFTYPGGSSPLTFATKVNFGIETLINAGANKDSVFLPTSLLAREVDISRGIIKLIELGTNIH